MPRCNRLMLWSSIDGYSQCFLEPRRVAWQLVVASFLHWQRPGAAYLLLADLFYLVGTILVTMLCNVPLNDSLAAVDPATADAASTWTNCLKAWTAWNHVRTVAALDAAALFTVALCF